MNQESLNFSSNECLENIRMYCNSFNTHDLFEININERSIFLPIEVAVSLSSKITKTLIQDPTIRKMNFDINFRDKDSYDIILNILEGNNSSISPSVSSNRNLFYDLCDFCLSFGNSFILQPFFNQKAINEDLESLSTSDLLQQINFKCNLLNYNQNNFNLSIEDEISYIAQNFDKFIKDECFIEWSKNEHNFIVLDQVISHDALKLSNEDSLLSFIIQLFEINPNFSILLKYVYIEYCSEALIKELISSIEGNQILQTQVQLSIFACLSRRCIKCLTLPIQHMKRYIQNYIEFPYDESNPLNGILNYEHANNNLTLIASSNNNPGDPKYGDVYSLIKMKDNTAFATERHANSYFEISLKDNTAFIIESYLIRGSDSTYSNLQNWALEGISENQENWTIIDSHQNEPINQYEKKVFYIQNPIEVEKIRLRQTGNNSSGNTCLYINGLEVYGKIISK